jgi:aromatic ring hydroxylase
MGLRNAEQYIESLRDGREVYIHGERVDDITKHPSLRKAIDHGAIDYEVDKRPELRDLLVTRSAKTGNEIRRYFELPRTAEDLLRRQGLIETTTRNGGSVVIFMKEIGTDALSRLKVMKLIRDMGSTEGAGEWWVGTLHGEGSLQAQRLSISREFNVKKCVDYVKELLEIK